MSSDNIEDEDAADVVAKKAAKKPAKRAVKKPEQNGDAEDIIKSTDVVVFMKSGYSYAGPNCKFTREAPFQRMKPMEATELIQSMPRRFELATREQVETFYSVNED